MVSEGHVGLSFSTGSGVGIDGDVMNRVQYLTKCANIGRTNAIQMLNNRDTEDDGSVEVESRAPYALACEAPSTNCRIPRTVTKLLLPSYPQCAHYT